ncbi:MAG: hypothetical protein WHX52_19200 [Anaerolineae bacterium]
MTKLSKENLKIAEELRKLREQTDPEEARRFLESLPEIDDNADTLALSFASLKGLKRRKPRETETEEPTQDE